MNMSSTVEKVKVVHTPLITIFINIELFQNSAAQPNAVANAVNAHHNCLISKPGALLPGSSGGKPNAGNSCKAANPHIPHIIPDFLLTGLLRSSDTPRHAESKSA